MKMGHHPSSWDMGILHFDPETPSSYLQYAFFLETSSCTSIGKQTMRRFLLPFSFFWKAGHSASVAVLDRRKSMLTATCTTVCLMSSTPGAPPPLPRPPSSPRREIFVALCCTMITQVHTLPQQHRISLPSTECILSLIDCILHLSGIPTRQKAATKNQVWKRRDGCPRNHESHRQQRINHLVLGLQQMLWADGKMCSDLGNFIQNLAWLAGWCVPSDKSISKCYKTLKTF